ncbi:MAG: LicD family protein, partial [Selenomonas sp.]|nr:LicD family protein [Selenomonas sp.]
MQELDKDILNYIKSAEGQGFASVLAKDSRFEVFEELSDYGQGILGWYDFSPTGSLLELGAGFGTRTEVFCRRCGQVTAVEAAPSRAEGVRIRCGDADRLTVVQADWQEYVLDLRDRFDYIVLVGGLEEVPEGFAFAGLSGPAAMVKCLLGLLKPDGRLFLAVDNRLGLRYFCGEPERRTGRPFAGINSFRLQDGKQLFSREEIMTVVREAGAKGVKCYYPLPNWHLPQLVYTDEYLPEDNLNERLLVYHPQNKTLLADEANLYSQVIRGGAFPFFANSFLLEVTNEPEVLSKAVYVALSSDRGREKALATVLYSDGRAVKRPLFLEGLPYGQRLVAQSEKLRNQGLPVLACSWQDGAVQMERIETPMLSSYLKEANAEEFIAIFDKLWQYILQSSEETDREQNALPGSSSCPQESWEPILQRAFLELIPLNAFYDRGEILFFDQEYVRENYPAKYVIFRAIHYAYVFSPELEKRVPRKALMERFGITENMWQVFVEEENGRFLPEVRQHKLYRHFYRWLQTDEKQMRLNAMLLGLDEEYSPEYVVSEKMRKIWQVQYGLLGAFVSFCQEHDLHYYVFFGTLLGAVRHRGFIPWDDDVDVVMPRADYDRLLALGEKFPAPYFLQTMDNDPDTFFGGFARLRNDETTGIGREDFGHDCHLGIWMDIMPLDFCSSDKKQVKKKAGRIHFWQSLLYAKIYGEPRRYILPGLRLLHKGLAWLLPHSFLCGRLQAAFRRDIDEKSKYLAIFTGGGMPGIYERDFFGEGVDLTFGSMRVKAPREYKKCLQLTAGRDYMKFPPMSKRKP